MGRILELDAVRGIAAVVIMLAHIGLTPHSPWVFSIIDMFFVLSGYLITKNVLKNRATPMFLPVFFTRTQRGAIPLVTLGCVVPAAEVARSCTIEPLPGVVPTMMYGESSASDCRIMTPALAHEFVFVWLTMSAVMVPSPIASL